MAAKRASLLCKISAIMLAAAGSLALTRPAMALDICLIHPSQENCSGNGGGPTPDAPTYGGNLSAVGPGVNYQLLTLGDTGDLAVGGSNNKASLHIGGSTIRVEAASDIFGTAQAAGVIDLPFNISTTSASFAASFNAFLDTHNNQGATVSGVVDLGFTGSGEADAQAMTLTFNCNRFSASGCGFQRWTDYVLMQRQDVPDAHGIYVWHGYVDLSALAYSGFLLDSIGGKTPGTAYAFIDPLIAVNPAFSGAAALTVTLPPGIANTTVPEPASWGLMLCGLGLAGANLRSKRGRPAPAGVR